MGKVELGHEKLVVYNKSMEFIVWSQAAMMKLPNNSVANHWRRASDSIAENIAVGNGKMSAADRSHYFEIALGSALECAACLDICRLCCFMSPEIALDGKRNLSSIVKMIVGLRRAEGEKAVKEEIDSWDVGEGKVYFNHETLDVYKNALRVVVWFEKELKEELKDPAYCGIIERSAVSLVLNIAEGNGRFSRADHRRFLDIAHSCAVKLAVQLDILKSRKMISYDTAAVGKRLLRDTVRPLLGLRDAFTT